MSTNDVEAEAAVRVLRTILGKFGPLGHQAAMQHLRDCGMKVMLCTATHDAIPVDSSNATASAAAAAAGWTAAAGTVVSPETTSKSNVVGAKSVQPVNQGKPWTEKENHLLVAARHQGVSFEAIALHLKRSQATLRTRYSHNKTGFASWAQDLQDTWATNVAQIWPDIATAPHASKPVVPKSVPSPTTSTSAPAGDTPERFPFVMDPLDHRTNKSVRIDEAAVEDPTTYADTNGRFAAAPLLAAARAMSKPKPRNKKRKAVAASEVPAAAAVPATTPLEAKAEAAAEAEAEAAAEAEAEADSEVTAAAAAAEKAKAHVVEDQTEAVPANTRVIPKKAKKQPPRPLLPPTAATAYVPPAPAPPPATMKSKKKAPPPPPPQPQPPAVAVAGDSEDLE